MSGERSFNDIHRGVPLMSRALLVERLRQLEEAGIVTKTRDAANKGHHWRLTEAGDGLREVIDVLGRWGLHYGREKVTADDYDSTVLMWAIRRVVVRFDLSGVARCRTAIRRHWLVLERSNVDACYKDPGYPVDAIVTGEVSALIAVYLGHATWREMTRRKLRVEGDRQVTRHLEKWLRLDQVVGRDLPIVPLEAA
jgi:DNA-binding HxlR family transcriptional regulator